MRINYTTPCSTDKLSDIRSFVRSQLTAIHLSEKDRYELILAIDEACANAIIHGNQCDCSRNLELELEIKMDKIRVDIYDVGNYHPNESNWRKRTINDDIRDRKKGGLGLRLIHNIMDKVLYYNKGQVTVCSLMKQFKKNPKSAKNNTATHMA